MGVPEVQTTRSLIAFVSLKMFVLSAFITQEAGKTHLVVLIPLFNSSDKKTQDTNIPLPKHRIKLRMVLLKGVLFGFALAGSYSFLQNSLSTLVCVTQKQAW